MVAQLAKLKRVAICLATIFTASISAMAHADWSIVELDTLGGDRIYPRGMNDSGQVIGWANTASGADHAFITGPNGIGITDLGTFLGGVYSSANDINESGQVVGSSNTASGAYHSFITGPNGIGMTDLGTLGGEHSGAIGINESGQVVGDSFTASGTRHAFITGPNGTGMTDIGTLGGAFSTAYRINDSGQAIGYSDTDVIGTTHAFITGPNGIGMTDLGTFGGSFSEAYGINNAGEAVGIADTAHLEYYSFIFSHGGITNLSLLAPVVAAGWTNINVFSINNNRQITGFGNHNGNEEAFLLSYTPDTVFTPSPIFIPSPIPEPETYLMLLCGLGLIGYLAWRRKEIAI